MPKYNVANIRQIERLLTDTADTLARAYSEFSLTEPDWDRPLAPDDAKLWRAVFEGMADELSTAIRRVYGAAQTLTTVADKYGQAEAAAEAKLKDIFDGIE